GALVQLRVAPRHARRRGPGVEEVLVQIQIAADPTAPVQGDESGIAEADDLGVAADRAGIRNLMLPVDRRGDEERTREGDELDEDGDGDEEGDVGRMAPLIRRFAPPSPRERGEG